MWLLQSFVYVKIPLTPRKKQAYLPQRFRPVSEGSVAQNRRQMRGTEDVFEVSEKQLIGGEEKLVQLLLRKEQKAALKQQPHVAQLIRFPLAHSAAGGKWTHGPRHFNIALLCIPPLSRF